jgi:hypothetical protein
MMSAIIQVPKSPRAVADLRADYGAAHPFPHIVLDGFLDPDAAEAALREFPSTDSGDWIRYRHASSSKLGKTDRRMFPPAIGRIIDALNSAELLAFIQTITEIPQLLGDDTLQGGGLHQSLPGGYLDVHADFTVHSQRPHWRRRVNLIVYLNREWEDGYGGHLELWDRDMKQCVKRISPLFNRCVMFNTDRDSYHGHPDPLRCPDGMTRKSIALYYYTEDHGRVDVRTTSYRARPGDPLRKKIAVALNAYVLQFYDRTKRAMGRLSSRGDVNA